VFGERLSLVVNDLILTYITDVELIGSNAQCFGF
jgi:hypothetical protein